ncbi:MAG: hypothetical protein EOP81_01480 [Variovorax sp.]|nr:MAG: hypothetical protein EOP81_01480 [Variovorax sp.]
MGRTPDGRFEAAQVVTAQQRNAATLRELERTRRAGLFWQRQRATFLRLLVEGMEEFGITQAELLQARRMAVEQGRRHGDRSGRDSADVADADLPE